jgi:NAD(P)-dependent dehydrogenase (short-subunit alcohol dehydrogenase family)
MAYLRFMRAAYPHLKASGEARIINFGSVAGVIGLIGYTPYNMAKEAVRALTRTAAREWGPEKITVDKVLPVAETWGPEANFRRLAIRWVAMDLRKRTLRRWFGFLPARTLSSSRDRA